MFPPVPGYAVIIHKLQWRIVVLDSIIKNQPDNIFSIIYYILHFVHLYLHPFRNQSFILNN